MSRFRIRKRIKDRLLGRIPTDTEDTRVTLTLVLPDGSEHVLQTEPHYTLIMASQTLDTPIHAHCPGGTCGGCRVDVLEGMEALRPAAEAETDLLDEHLGPDRDPNVRLACHARLVGSGAKVEVHKVWSLEEAMGAAPSED